MPASLFAARERSLSDQPEDTISEGLEGCPNITFKRILVPLDFSETCRSALGHAVTLALQFHAEIVLLHVFEPVPPELKVFESTFADPGFREQAANELQEWHKLVPRSLSAETVLREARTAQRGILNATAEFHIDLIVMGRHRHKGLERVFGGTAQYVLKRAHCAVLLTSL